LIRFARLLPALHLRLRCPFVARCTWLRARVHVCWLYTHTYAVPRPGCLFTHVFTHTPVGGCGYGSRIFHTRIAYVWVVALIAWLGYCIIGWFFGLHTRSARHGYALRVYVSTQFPVTLLWLGYVLPTPRLVRGLDVTFTRLFYGYSWLGYGCYVYYRVTAHGTRLLRWFTVYTRFTVWRSVDFTFCYVWLRCLLYFGPFWPYLPTALWNQVHSHLISSSLSISGFLICTLHFGLCPHLLPALVVKPLPTLPFSYPPPKEERRSGVTQPVVAGLVNMADSDAAFAGRRPDHFRYG